MNDSNATIVATQSAMPAAVNSSATTAHEVADDDRRCIDDLGRSAAGPRSQAARGTTPRPSISVHGAVRRRCRWRRRSDHHHRHAEPLAQVEQQIEHALRRLESSAPVGSSASSRRGSLASARATATRWRSPPESCEGRWSARSAEPHLLEQFQRAAPALARVRSGADQRYFDVHSRGERLEQQVALKDEADHLAAGACRIGPLPDACAVDRHAPAVGVLQVADQREQRALAGAGAAVDQNRLTSLDAKRQASQSADLSERLRRHHAQPPQQGHASSSDDLHGVVEVDRCLPGGEDGAEGQRIADGHRRPEECVEKCPVKV